MRAFLLAWRAFFADHWDGLVTVARDVWYGDPPSRIMPPAPVTQRNEPSPEEVRRRADEARQILGSDALRRYQQAFEEDLAHRREQVPILDRDMHTRLIEVEQLYRRFIKHFVSTVEEGDFARLQIERRETAAERFQAAMMRGLRA